MEKHLQRLLVHAVAVWDAAAAQQTDGADADHDAGQPPGGAKLRVLLHPARLQRQEADSLHCLNVDQRLLLSQLDYTEFVFSPDNQHHVKCFRFYPFHIYKHWEEKNTSDVQEKGKGLLRVLILNLVVHGFNVLVGK